MNPSKRRLAGLIAAILVPLLAAGVFFGLVGNRGESRISAAVVNLDEAVTVKGQYVPMGRQLSAAMVDRDGRNIDWTLADAPSAAAGLKSGRFSAVVTIPKSFSAAATSFSANDAAKAEQATIEVQVSDNSPVTDSALAQEISRLAVDTINSTLTKGYLDGIYVGFNTVGEQFTTIVDGARQLHDGSSALADGAEKSAQGATQLSAGMQKLADNGPKLVEGGDKLIDGIGELHTGTGQLSTGATKFSDGVDTFAAQTPKLVDGVGQLAGGADQLLGGIPAFAEGSASAIGGVTSIRKGLDEVVQQLEQSGGGSGTGELDKLKQGAAGIAQGATGLSKGLDQVSGALGQYSQGHYGDNPQVKGGIENIKSQMLAAAQCSSATESQACGAVAAAVDAGFQAGTGTAAAMLTTADETTGQSIVSGAGKLAAGADELSAGVAKTVDAISAQAGQLAELTAGLTKLRDGARTLEEKAAPIVSNAPALSKGATSLNEGIQQLNTQIGQLPSGVNQLAGGARQLADGVAALDKGVGTLQDGARQYGDGIAQYVDGVAAASDGTSKLSDGLVQLSSGASKLDGGVGTFASELAKGAKQVPSYSQSDRETLSKVVASPVERNDSLFSPGSVALVSLLLLTGLWLGALISFLAVRPVPKDAVASRESSVSMWVRVLWQPACAVAALGLVLGVVGGIALHAGVGRTVALAGLLVLLGLSFVLANHALAGWLGNVGRAISALLLVATIGLGVSSALGWLGPIGTVSPLNNGLLLVRTWLSGGSGAVGIATLSVLMFVVAAVASYLSISTRRHISVDQFRRTLSRAA